MRIKSILAVIGVLALMAFLVPWLQGAATGKALAQVKKPLVSFPVKTAPILDGNATDAAWEKAEAIKLPVKTFGTLPFEMTIKSVYTADTVYFLFQYPDSNMEVDPAEWAFDTDQKTWSRIADEDIDEDEFGLWWNINMPDYATKGCAQACHENHTMVAPKDTSADQWQWNAGRSNPMGWVRNLSITDNPEADEAGGFVKKEGFKTNEGYKDNLQKINGVKLPAYWKPFSDSGGISVGDPRYLLQSEIDAGLAKAIKSVDANTGELIDETGAKVPTWVHIPGRILSAPAGPSWNKIKGKGTWANGVWTVEWARALKTGFKDDVQFSDLKATYYFDGYIKTRQPGEKDHAQILTTAFQFAAK